MIPKSVSDTNAEPDTLTHNCPEGSEPVSMGLYYFEFKFIPYLLDLSSKRQIHPLNIANKDFIISFTERCCDRVEWQWDDFNSEAGKVGDSVLLLYWFPEPTTPPLAKFAAAVVSESGLTYYTLEYDDYDGRSVWYLCTQDAQKHYNIGQVEECATMEDFVRLLQDKVLDA